MSFTAGETPLFYAAAVDGVEIARLLVSKGADIHRVNSEGENALAWAILGPYSPYS